MDAEHVLHKIYGVFGSKEAIEDGTQELRWTTRGTEEHASPSVDLWHRKGKHLLQKICGGGILSFSGQVQVDAAAKLDGDEVRCGDDGGALVTDGDERKKMRNGKNEGRPSRVYL